jgi:hypothetical protein
MIRYHLKTVLLCIIFAVNRFNVPAQTNDYELLFGNDWKKAQAFEKENRYWMEPVLKRNHVSYPLAIAVIFPELVRYSALRDKMEITLLKALYVNLGDEYADFSIGQFQMKPSFASSVRELAPVFQGRRTSISFKGIEEYDNITNYRKAIVSDLEDPAIQLNYLIAFINICEKKFKTNRKNAISRVIFISTAYNYGIDKSSAQIDSMAGRKFFNTKLLKSETYSYSDVSLFWYNNFLKENKKEGFD